LAKVSVEERATKAGSVVSQIEFNVGQRASLARRKLGVMAVLTGPDNHTSVFATDLKIEAEGMDREFSWTSASWAGNPEQVRSSIAP